MVQEWMFVFWDVSLVDEMEGEEVEEEEGNESKEEENEDEE